MFENFSKENINCFLSIQVGTGGKDACDWVEVLFRMYQRFAKKKDWQVKILEEQRTDEGIRKAVLFIKGKEVYSILQKEKGVHRLVRLSPFSAKKLRHTSFALVEVFPEIPLREIEIKEKDLKIDTFAASGHGGQHVNKTYSAVRITHLLTNITVTCQNERSQGQNKEMALRMLKGKLSALEEKRREEEKLKLKGKYVSPEWGNQIRSYVLHPYKMVKDLKTGFKSSQVEKVLDGDLDLIQK